MSRQGKGVPQLSGDPSKRGSPSKRSGGGTRPPASAAPPLSAAPPPAAASPAAPPPPLFGPCGPGYAASPAAPQNSSPHGAAASPAASQCLTIANPWAGYFNMFQQSFLPPLQPFGENSHFVGATNNFQPPSPAPAAPYANERASIDLDEDDGVEASKSVKKRYWSHDEEVRLASAWLNTSKDPIHGNDKKSDSFWGQITKEFNQNSQQDHHRDTNSLKIHWICLSKMINEFNGYWISVCKMNKSGYSDDQLMEEAQKRYEKKNEKPFTLIHWWKILKDEPKWCTFVAQSEKDKSKKNSQAIDVDDKAEQRPIGRESAKQERRGKRKADQVLDGIEILGENINKIVEVTQERKKEREQTIEAQLEICRMNLQTAKDHKEAELLEAYTALLARDTSQMSAEGKISHEKTLLKMEKMIFKNDDEP